MIREVLPKNLDGDVRPLSKPLSLSKTKTQCNSGSLCPIYDLTKNSMPYILKTWPLNQYPDSDPLDRFHVSSSLS